MRIVYLSGSTIPSMSANSIQVMRMCAAFADEGHEVTLIAQDGYGQNVYETYGVRHNFEIVRLTVSGTPRLRQWRYGWQAVSSIRSRLPIDVVYGRHLPGLAMASFLKVPIIYEAHVPAQRTGRLIESWLLRRSTFSQLITISAALRSEYLRRYPDISQLRILVSANAAVSVPPNASRRVKPRGERLQIGYTGHLYPGKGMEMVARLARRLSSFDFHVVGGTEAELRRWQTEAGRCRNLSLHGHVPPAQVSAWQQEMDVLIVPCQKSIRSAGGADIAAWTSPLKLFEYLAAGKPVVASDIPVLREVLQDGENALLAPPDDVDAWAERLQRLVDPCLREELGQRARQAVQNQFNWTHRARHVLQEIEYSIGTCHTGACK
jgi:glycosyltransferase involved in cell wall biosynthesis